VLCIYWGMMLRRVTEAYGGMCRLHLQGGRESQENSVRRLHIPPKLLQISSKSHVVACKDDDRL
jgi:hypothetical protein